MTVTSAPADTRGSLIGALLGRVPLLVGCAVAVVYLSVALRALTSDVPTTNAEGNQLHGTLRVQAGQPLYLDFREMPFVVTPYTPLYYLLTGSSSSLLGLDMPDVRTFTRSVSFVATIAVAGMVYLLSRASGAGVLAGLTAAVFFLPLPFMDRWSFTSRPDMLAILLSMVAAGVVMRWPRIAALAAVVAVLAFFTKQTSIAAPAAITLWLCFTGWWRQAVGFSVVWLVLVAAGVAALNSVSSGTFLQNVFFAHLNPTNGLDAAAVAFLDLPRYVWPFLVLAILTAYIQTRRGALALTSVYWLVSLLVLFYTLRGRGAAENYFIEPSTLTCILAAVSLEPLLRVAASRTAKGIAVALGLAAIAIVWGWQLWAYWRVGGELPLDRPVAVPEITRAERIWSEEPSLTVFAGKELLVSDPFLLSQMWEGGHYDVAPLVNRVRQRYFDLIIVRGDVRQPRALNSQLKWPEPVLKAIAEFYQRSAVRGPYWVYVPDRPR